MLLAIDVGNTNTGFAVCDGGTIRKSWRLRTDSVRSADEYAAFLIRLLELEGLGFSNLKAVVVSSVVPEANFHLAGFAQRYIGTDAFFVERENVGIAVELERPEEVGADRLVNALAVLIHYKAPAIVIDFGTATTFDVVGKDGVYQGGVIAPGINLSVSALHAAAAKLPKVSVVNPGPVIGRSTKHAIQSGIFYGYLGLIEGVVKRIGAEMGNGKPFVLATGGLAPLFAADTDAIDAVDDDLTIKGLIEIYKRMKG
ncbi:MAG: type III pantothenate kinase [Alphaproteobacteria bacterium]|nr:type III pantothenate kinase [Alphaproteobacteria bacterium]MCD8570103.1 type III pantothenate kinase [Alphaproteobacteria bacterium]